MGRLPGQGRGGLSAGELIATALLPLILLLSLWVYAPGTSGGFLLDDKNSVAPLARLDPGADGFLDVVRAEQSGPLGRPLAAASFVFERLYLGADARQMKHSNVLLHGLVGVLVCWLSLLLLRYRAYSGSSLLAVIAMAIWLLAPLQVSTVLYTVQRMTILAAALVLLALVAYVKWRSPTAPSPVRGAWALLCAGAVAAAPFAKENGLLALPLLVIVEVFWLRPIAGPVKFRATRALPARWLATAGAAAATMLGGALVWALDFAISGYAARRFDLLERLLTQGWALWDYLLQFYWPDVARLGVYHDDFPVRSLLTDGALAVLPLAAMAVLAMIALIAALRHRIVLPALVLGFFLVAHALESTIFALEFYFEHRNYLPSFALAFLPVAALGALGQRMPQIVAPAAVCLALLVLTLATRTAALAQIWSRDALLAVHHADGHPHSARANVDMASLLAGLGEVRAAYGWSERAHRATLEHRGAREERDGDYRLRNLALACQAKAPPRIVDLAALRDSDSARPLGETYTLEILTLLYMQDACPDSGAAAVADALNQLFLEDPRPERAGPGVYIAVATLMNHLQHIDEAAHYVALVLSQQPLHARALLMQLHFARLLDRPGLARDSERRLLRLGDEGMLTAREVQTLAFYEDYLRNLED